MRGIVLHGGRGPELTEIHNYAIPELISVSDLPDEIFSFAHQKRNGPHTGLLKEE